SPTLLRNFTIATSLPAATISTGVDGVIRRTAGTNLSLEGTGTWYSEEAVQTTARIYTLDTPPPAGSAHACVTTPGANSRWGCDFGTTLPVGTYLARVDQSLPSTGTTVSILYTLVVEAAVVPDLEID